MLAGRLVVDRQAPVGPAGELEGLLGAETGQVPGPRETAQCPAQEALLTLVYLKFLAVGSLDDHGAIVAVQEAKLPLGNQRRARERHAGMSHTADKRPHDRDGQRREHRE